MPYSLILTKNGANEEVSAVPEGWVVGSYLYWPRTLKKSEIESLRSNENSIPDKSWKKMKCRLKLNNISSFEEALRLEDLYSKFQDTEDEELYHDEHKNKKKQTVVALSNQLLDVNSKFDLDENNIIQDGMVNPDKIIAENVSYSEEINKQVLSSANQDNVHVTLNDVQGTSSDEVLTITTNELLKIIQENNSLQTENKVLKEELQQSVEFRNATKMNFAILQTQMDKIIDLLQNKNQVRSSSIIAKDSLYTFEDGIHKMNIGNLKFPIETKEQLDNLEYKLLEKDVMTDLIKKLSETCGTSGVANISKIGLPLMKRFIKDELLNQFTWKGIKGSTKMAFIQYVKIRELFYKVAHLADNSCCFSDSDFFIQNSAIKHSGQRIKRQLLYSENKKNVKRMKIEISKIEKDNSDKMIPDAEMIDNEMNKENRDINKSKIDEEKSGSEKHSELKNNKERTDESDRRHQSDSDTLNTGKLQGTSVKIAADDHTNTLNQPSSSKVTILSDVKICNKVMDIKNLKKTANISSTNVSAIFDLIDFSS